jgi:hypothetical protein
MSSGKNQQRRKRMEEFSIKQISNGWVLQGWIIDRSKREISLLAEKELYLPTIHAVADILTTWQQVGFAKAAVRAKEKYFPL